MQREGKSLTQRDNMKVSLKTTQKGPNTLEYLHRMMRNKNKMMSLLRECGEEGVAALEKNTPKRTGLTAASWHYKIESTPKGYTLFWYNDNLTKDGDPVAILIQYGHSTYQGYYVKGVDYINPAMKPVFDSILDKLKVVTI